MFIEYIHELIETLVNTQTADIFSAPLALLLSLMLVFWLFTLFSSGKTKTLVLTFILITVLIFAVFSMASTLGYITLPIVLGGA